MPIDIITLASAAGAPQPLAFPTIDLSQQPSPSVRWLSEHAVTRGDIHQIQGEAPVAGRVCPRA